MGTVLLLQVIGLHVNTSNTRGDPWRPAISFDRVVHQSSQEENVFLEAECVNCEKHCIESHDMFCYSF